MGVGPLLRNCNSQLFLAQKSKAILAHPAYQGLNYQALYHYFTLKNVPAPLTAFGNLLFFPEGLLFSEVGRSKAVVEDILQ
jgi:hypothetical protein